jgi:polyisoprenoid-binding protein YceI
MRDKHVKSDDFFNAEKYPTITFKSKSIKSLGGNKYVLVGDLTIRDVTRQVEIPVVYGGTVKDPWGNTKAGFKATGKINRKDYGLKYSNAAAGGEAVVGDDVDFTVDLVLIKQS